MRRQNSDFQTGFISEVGNKLENNDYFGYIELDEFACYVIADGLNDITESEGARVAIETVISNFQAKPSMSKWTLRKLLNEANKVMQKKRSYRRLKASLTVIVTDYQKIRYGYAGNTRFRMYRGGYAFLQTKDMSLSQDMVERHQIPIDEVMRHEERNNLYCYLGQKKFNPFISKKIKLVESDILVLYTRGIWENVDEAELDDVFSEASNEVYESLNNVEDLLLSRQPENLDNYTLSVIFVNKLYNDPEESRKRKKIIIISIILIVITLVLGVLIWYLHSKRVQRMEDMNYHFTNTIEYINSGNYIRAKEECQQAQELSKQLKDNDMRERLQEYMFVIETVIQADECFDEKDYQHASEYFISALNRTRFADNIGNEYIEKRLGRISDYQYIEDYLELGDKLQEEGQFASAEEKYLLAKNKAAEAYDSESKQKAKESLEKLYEEWSKAESEEEQAAKAKADETVAAAQMVANGDKACLSNDFIGAKVFYTMAIQKYEELGDTVGQKLVEEKLDAVEQKVTEQENQRNNAKLYENQGAECQNSDDYWGAKAQYLLAKAIYQEMGSSEDVERIKNIVSVIDTLIEQSEE